MGLFVGEVKERTGRAWALGGKMGSGSKSSAGIVMGAKVSSSGDWATSTVKLSFAGLKLDERTLNSYLDQDVDVNHFHILQT